MAELPGRSLARSLDPLTGESIGGYLLRLAHRLRLSPIRLARLTGCTKQPSSTQLGRRLLLDLDVRTFARATRLSEEEAAALTLLPWADRYPPIWRLTSSSILRPTRDNWLFNKVPRYCPRCLAGDGTAIQQQHGGPWKKAWHLPVAFICPAHRMFLQSDCPQSHPSGRVATVLISQPADTTLHPAQCRHPAQRAGQGRTGPSCGTRLDHLESTSSPCPSEGMLGAQQRLLDLLEDDESAEDAASFFTDLRVVAAVLCASWPFSRELIEPESQDAVGRHVQALNAGARPVHDSPPQDSAAAAGLLTAAVRLLNEPDRHELVVHARAGRPGSASRAPWVPVFERNESACSDGFRQAMAPLTRTYRRTGTRGGRIPQRQGGYRPEHIPAFLEQSWYERHLAPLQPGSHAKMLRRLGAVFLVQWSMGGSMGDAANFLGINPKGGQYASTGGVYRWLEEQGTARFTTVLQDLAQELDVAPAPIDYQYRRFVLRNWCLSLDLWKEIIGNLPPVPGPFQPIMDDRKRQEASAFVWAEVTQGEPRLAPRPIEAAQPDPVRSTGLQRRSSTWAKLTRPDPMAHYAALRDLLLQHAEHLTREIDSDSDTVWLQLA